MTEISEAINLPPDTPFSNAITCQKCGCHDASVRQVIYPYVFSLLVITFRREFHGRWCWKHRILYLLLAVLITGTFGWLGFPFGLIYTPATLYRLARGLVMHKASNLKLTRALAESNQQRGFLNEARRCMEISMQFVDDLWGRQQLEQVYTFPPAEKNRQERLLGSSKAAAILFAVAMLLGGLAGLLSHYTDKIYDLSTGSEFDILAPLFFWMPLAIICLALIFSLRQIQEMILENHPFRNPILILGMSLVSGLLAAYGLLEGRQIGNFLDILQDQPILPAGSAFWTTLGALLSRGGLIEIPQELYWIDFWNFVHHVLLTAIPIFFPLTMILAAWPYLVWEKLLNQIRARSRRKHERLTFPDIGWVLPYAGAACLVGLLFLFPQQAQVDFVEARDHFVYGNLAMNDEDYEKAVNEYKAAVQLDPQYAPAYVELGWAYYQQDEISLAIENYINALKLAPGRVSAHYELGRIYYYDDQLENAAAEFDRVLKLEPDNYRAYLGLGWVAYDQGELDRAEANFRKTLDYNGQIYDAYLGLGYIYEDKNQIDQEITAYQHAVDLDPDSSNAQMLLGMAYYDKNELDLAVPSLEKAIRLNPDNQMARVYLTRAYIYTGHPDTAVQFSQETLNKFPDWAGAHALLALSLIETRQVDTALAELQAARDIPDQTDTDRQIILRALLNADQPIEAELVAKEALKDGERPANFYLFLAEAYSVQGKYSEAFATCDQASRAGVKEADVLTQRASIYLDQEAADQSLAELQQALQLDPQNAYAYYLLSVAYSDTDDDQLALEAAQKATVLDRYYYGAYVRMAASQTNIGNAQEVIRAASRAALLSPYADIPHFFLGMAYLETGQENNAAVELQKFLDLYQGRPNEQELKNQAEDAIKRINKTF